MLGNSSTRALVGSLTLPAFLRLAVNRRRGRSGSKRRREIGSGGDSGSGSRGSSRRSRRRARGRRSRGCRIPEAKRDNAATRGRKGANIGPFRARGSTMILKQERGSGDRSKGRARARSRVGD
jgi:hypothetical protein